MLLEVLSKETTWLADSCSEAACACLSVLAQHVLPTQCLVVGAFFSWQFVKFNAYMFSPIGFKIEVNSC